MPPTIPFMIHYVGFNLTSPERLNELKATRCCFISFLSASLKLLNLLLDSSFLKITYYIDLAYEQLKMDSYLCYHKVCIRRYHQHQLYPWCSHFNCSSWEQITWKDLQKSPESVKSHPLSMKREVFNGSLSVYIYRERERDR